MPLDLILRASTVGGGPRHTDDCPAKDIVHPIEGREYGFIYGGSDLWEAIHAHPEFHDLTGEYIPADGHPDHDRVARLADIIAEQVHPLCVHCKQRLIVQFFTHLALFGEVMTDEHHDAVYHSDDQPTH